MRPVAVVGPREAGRERLVADLIARLAERGAVGSVSRADGDPTSSLAGNRRVEDGRARAGPESGDVRRAYEVGDGGWVAAGASLSLTDALDDLARTCDFAVVEGFPDATLPRVVLGADGDAPSTGTREDAVLARAPTAADVDPSSVVDAVVECDPYVTLATLVDRIKDAPGSDRAGAVATFTGRVRARDDPDDVRTEYLEFERYDEVADETMAAIREDLCAREGVHEVLLHHETGVVEAGEDIVFVVVLAGHRREAFRAVEDGIDRLKAEVPLFKKEVTVEGASWAHERESDHTLDS